MVEEPTNDTEDLVGLDNLVALVDGNTVTTPVDCIDGGIARELLGTRGERVSIRDEVRV